MARTTRRQVADRKKLFVDAKIQGALLVRAVMYWIFALMAITLMLLCWRIITGPVRSFYNHFDHIWFFYGPALVASFVLLPVVLVDVVKLSNRFVGPLVRFRRALRALASGEHVEPIQFRQGDYWQEMADEFNVLVRRLQRDRPEVEPEDQEAVGAAP
jgi:hypothetical protein